MSVQVPVTVRVPGVRCVICSRVEPAQVIGVRVSKYDSNGVDLEAPAGWLTFRELVGSVSRFVFLCPDHHSSSQEFSFRLEAKLL